MSESQPTTILAPLKGRRVLLAGRLAGLNKREAQQRLRAAGATVVERVEPAENAAIDLVVLGEAEVLPTAGDPPAWLSDELRAAVERGTVEVIGETQLWQRLGLIDDDQDVRRLYTTAMLAQLLDVPARVIRRWHRRGLIRPVREVRRLAYFDFQEVATARRLAELLLAGVSPQAIESQLAALRVWLPHVERPLAQLSTIVEGKHLLLRQGDGLVEPSGQKRIDFAAADAPLASQVEPAAPPVSLPVAPPVSFEQKLLSAAEMIELAEDCEDEGRLAAAAELYRTALAAAGPDAEINFRLAEVLYRQGDLTAARERYYAAIELDDDYVEARANLGCVLVEANDVELAISAFQGALAFHPDYADAHYLLARTLDEQHRPREAEPHWRRFLELAGGESAWTHEARARLTEAPA